MECLVVEGTLDHSVAEWVFRRDVFRSHELRKSECHTRDVLSNRTHGVDPTHTRRGVATKAKDVRLFVEHDNAPVACGAKSMRENEDVRAANLVRRHEQEKEVREAHGMCMKAGEDLVHEVEGVDDDDAGGAFFCEGMVRGHDAGGTTSRC